MLGPAQAARGVVVEMTRQKTPTWVLADRRRLEQVFVNILSNSVKYNRPDGRVRVSSAVENQMLVVSIEDEGVGMTTNQQAQLFQPFNRLGAERLGIEGAGLGLVISRQLVAAMGGELTLTSEPRRGTRVRIALPQVQAPAPPAVAAPRGGDPLDALEMPPALLLYVEDDPVNALLVEQYVSRWPHLRLVVAQDGETGLRNAMDLGPDLILLDMQLPDMDGLEFLARTHAEPASSKQRVIVLSADAMPRQVEASMASGAEAYWTKPLDYRRFCCDLAATLRASPPGPFAGQPVA
jgi:hypothetical protein